MAQRSKQQRPKQQHRPAVPVPAPWFEPTARGLVIATTLLVLLVFSNGFNDVYGTPKEFVLLLGGLALLGTWLWSTAASGVAVLPRSRPVLALGGVLAVMALATITNGYRLRSLFGEYGRGAGLLSYVAAALLLLAVVSTFDERAVVNLLRWFGGVGAVVILYGLLQVAGTEPVSVPTSHSVVSTLGQLNFVAGFSGILLPIFLWLAASRRHEPPWRIAGAVLAVLTVYVALNAQSFQVVGALGAGAGLFAFVWALDRWPVRSVVLASVAVLVLALAAALVAHAPLERQLRDGFGERVLMWQAGRDMAIDRPILGRGPSGYASEFSTYRPRAHALRFGLFQIVDAPHDVPLAMLVSGGVLLLGAYVAFVGLVGWALVAALRRSQGERRLLLGAVGAAWLAYQVQSLVSIDVPALMACHFVMAGAVIVLSDDVARRTGVLPWLAQGRGRGLRVTGVGRAVQGVAVVLVAVGIWAIARPLIADKAFASGRDARASGNADATYRDFGRATGLAPWVGSYWAASAGAYADFGDQDHALADGIRAAEEMPSAVSYALSTAQFAARMSRNDIAVRFFDLAIAHSPDSADVYGAKGRFLVEIGKPRQAIPLLEQALALRADFPSDLYALGAAYADVNDGAKSRAVYERVLKLEPGSTIALEALGRKA